MRLFYYLFLVLSLLWTSGLFPQAQNRNQMLKIADQLIRQRSYNQAESILELLYQCNSKDYRIYSKLKHVYLEKQDYEKAVTHIQSFIQLRPNYKQEEAALGQVYYHMGEEEKAREKWQSMIDADPDNSQSYHLVAQSMIRTQLHEDAIEVYLKGQKVLDDPYAFASTLASLYESLKQYEMSTRMLLYSVISNEKYENRAMSRFRRYPKSEDVQLDITKVMEEIHKEHPDSKPIKRILSQQYIRINRFQDAFALIYDLEKHAPGKKQGVALYQFSKDAFRAGFYSVSEQALKEIVLNYPKYPEMHVVKLDLAQTCHYQQKFADALSVFDDIIRFYPNSFIELSALHEKARLLRDSLNNSKEAYQIFVKIKKRFYNTQEGQWVDYEIGKCYFFIEEYPKAVQAWRISQKQHEDKKNAIWLKSTYALAMTYGAMGRFPESIGLLDSLKFARMEPELMAHEAMNDALRFQKFLKTYKKADKNVLKTIILGSIQIDQDHFTQAMTLLDSALTMDQDTTMIHEILFKKARVLSSLHSYSKAIDIFNQIKSQYPSSSHIPDVYYQSGILLEKMNKQKQALVNYEKIIMDYPHHLSAFDARKRIRVILEM